MADRLARGRSIRYAPVLGLQQDEPPLTCSKCGVANEPGAKFCNQCGTGLLSGCPSCGTINAPNARFCSECASPLPVAASRVVEAKSTVPVVPIAERRLVSILFADLVGFTTLAEGQDAEDTRELLSRYFEVVTHLIVRYGGTVEKFIGDAIMAVWGAPTAHEDDAERAVRAALDLVDAVKTLGPGIAARAGVLTGEAAVTIGAANQGMVAGDLVNTASRLQSVAEPGTVLVGQATQRAASKAVVFEEVGSQTLKGKAAQVPAWRAVRVVAQLGGRNRSEALEAPFVGRDDELRLLKDLFHATGGDRRARLVSVIGPAGIGKTRLAWELLKYLDGLVDTVWFHAGRSPAYGEGVTFWALGEMVRRRAGLLETDGEHSTRAKIAETLATHVPDESERRWIEPALLVLLGVETSVTGSEQLFAAWRTFFERLAATAPVVMVFEDFHYADAGLIDFVDHLLEWSRNVPIYVVTLSRPELLEKRPEWGAGKRNFTSLYLEPLTQPAMRELLAGLVPGLPEAAAQAIVTRADGIPLYAVETVRMLLAEGRLRLDGERYVPVGDLTSLAVPETLTALIASRLDALDPADRALVSDAAVLGQSFTLAGLSAVSGTAEGELGPRLRTLVRRELLTLEADPRSPERGQYSFVQALIREVAYNTLAKRERKSLHLSAARFLESLETEEIAGVLAGHYLAAHANAAKGPEADALAGQARVALRAAAERAIALGSYLQAFSFFEQCRTVTSEPAESATLLERAGDAASAAGRYEVAADRLAQSIAEWRELEDRPAIAGATAALGRALLYAGDHVEAIELLEPAAEEFTDLAVEPSGIALGGQLARAYFLHEDNHRAIDVADRVLEAAEHADLPAIIADTLVTKGSALASCGRPIEGLGVLATGRELAEARGLGRTLLRAENNLAALGGVGDPRRALEMARHGLELARRLGVKNVVADLIVNLTFYSIKAGEWSAALNELESVRAEEWEPTDRLELLLSEIRVRALCGDDVGGLLSELEMIVGEDADSPRQGRLWDARAEIAFAGGDLEAARTAYHRVLDYFPSFVPEIAPRAARAAVWSGDALGARDDLATIDRSGIHGPALEAGRLTVQAGLAAVGGDPAEAVTLYRQALRAWQQLGLAWDEALCQLDMAILLDPSDPGVLAAAELARETMTRLGAKPFLARLESATHRPSTAEVPNGAGATDRSAV